MSRFHYNTTVHLIKAGESANGDMLMKGVASTPAKDTDKQYLNPRGFDCSYFLAKGFINWNHEWKKNPLSIIGRPTKAEVNDSNELEIEYSLFKGHKTAEEVYQLAGILEQNGLYLGLSIEGEVTEFDPVDKSKVLKARITDCAVTPHPKNNGTVTSIIKANEFKELVDFERLGEFEVTSGGELIIKGVSTAEGEALMPESVEGMNDKKKKKNNGIKQEKLFSKSEVFERLKRYNKNITLGAADAIFNYAQKLQKSIEMTEQGIQASVTDDALNAALKELNLIEKGEGGEPIAPETPATEGGASSVEGEEGAGAPIKKGIEERLSALSELTPEERNALKSDLEKSLSSIIALETPAARATPEAVEARGSELLKAIQSSITTSQEKLEGFFFEKARALGQLVEAARGEVERLSERVEVLERTPDQPRAVMTKAYVTKAIGHDAGEGEGMETFSLSKEKAQLCSRLTDAAIEKAQGVDKIEPRLRADLIALEAGSHVSPKVIEFAKSLNIEIIA